MLIVDQVLTQEDLAHVNAELDTLEFVDGKNTAGVTARAVKFNEQLSKKDPRAKALERFIVEAIQRNNLFLAYSRPRLLSPILFNQYQSGMAYGRHVDDAIMGAMPARWRSDLSFTLFLTKRDDYEGGALQIEAFDGKRRVRLEAGQAIIYPSTTIHEVEPVIRGVRRAAVGWIQSFVRDETKRELLFDLLNVKNRLAESAANRDDILVLSKIQSNLIRMWADM